MNNIVSIKRFDRHAEMSSETRSQIIQFINDLKLFEIRQNIEHNDMENYLFGLFDGYYYEEQLFDNNMYQEISNKSGELKDTFDNIIQTVESYNLYDPNE